MVLAITASLIVGCAIGLIGGVLFARSMFLPHLPFGRHFERPGGRLHYIERELDLNKDQSDRIEKIVEASRAESDSIRAQARQQILQVLTPEQREKWQRMEPRFHHDGPPRGPGEPGDEPPPPPDRR